MLSRCIRQILLKKNTLNVARNLVSGRSFTGKNVVIFQSSSQGHPASLIPARSLYTSKVFLDSTNTATEESYLYGNEADQWTKVNDTGDEVTGAFSNFRLTSKTIKKLNEQGINYLFPVQSNTFNPIYDEYDVIVQARTGSGKTISYAIPLVEKVLSKNSTSKNPKMLVLTPTRELANQVAKVVESLTDVLKVVPVYGGSDISAQENKLKRKADIVVGTPGRIIDLIERGSLNLSELEHVVLDEVDRMLDMGFSDSVDKILQNRYKRDQKESNPQTLLFSATVPHWVRETSKKYLSRDLKMIDLIGKHTNRTAVNVKHLAMMGSMSDRINVVLDALRRHSEDGGVAKVIVFCQTKKEVDQLGNNRALKDKVGVLHGDVTQNMREITLKRFKDGQLSCLVATDVAARGLDVPDVDVVVQCSPPSDVESYIHRSGRTGRAGKSGESILLYSPNEAGEVRKIEGIAGFTFEKVVYKKSMEDIKKDVKRALSSVGPSSRQKFEGIAAELLEGAEPAKVLSSAIAALSGYEQKSLITFQTGFVTLKMNCGQKLNTVWDAQNFLNQIDMEIKYANIRLCSDKKSFVFDISMHIEEEFLSLCQGYEKVDAQSIESLPQLDNDKRYNSADGTDSGRNYSSLRSGNKYSGNNRGGYQGNNREGYQQRGNSYNKEGNGQKNSYNKDGYGQRDSYNKGGYGQRDSYNKGGYGQRDSYNKNNQQVTHRRATSVEDFE